MTDAEAADSNDFRFSTQIEKMEKQKSLKKIFSWKRKKKASLSIDKCGMFVRNILKSDEIRDARER